MIATNPLFKLKGPNAFDLAADPDVKRRLAQIHAASKPQPLAKAAPSPVPVETFNVRTVRPGDSTDSFQVRLDRAAKAMKKQEQRKLARAERDLRELMGRG
jgi:hypothetical protein